MNLSSDDSWNDRASWRMKTLSSKQKCTTCKSEDVTGAWERERMQRVGRASQVLEDEGKQQSSRDSFPGWNERENDRWENDPRKIEKLKCQREK